MKPLKNPSQLMVAVSLLLTALVATQAQGEKAYNIGMNHWIAWSPLNVAEARGFWRDQGINVKVVNYANEQELMENLKKGNVDVGVGMIGNWLGMYLNGEAMTILGETDWSHGGDKIIAKKGFNIAHLKGTSIGVYLNHPSVTYFVAKYLGQSGIKLADCRVVEMETEGLTEAFNSGRFQLIANYDPQALRAQRVGHGVAAATSATYPGCIPEGFAMLSDKYQAISKADLVKIMRGWTRGVEWAQDAKNWAEFIKVLNAKTFVGGKPYAEADLKEMLGAVRIHDRATLRQRNQKTGGLEAFLADMHQFLDDNQLLKRDFAPATLLNSAEMLEAVTP